MAKGYSLCKIPTLVYVQNNMRKTFLQHIEFVVCKKRLEKTAIIWKMRAFWKWPKMATKQKL